MRQLACVVALLVASSWADRCRASVYRTFHVVSTGKINGQAENPTRPAPHGLWTSNDRSNLMPLNGGLSGSNYFDVTDLRLKLYTGVDGLAMTPDDFATLKGTVINPYGDMATIDLIMSGFEDALPSGAGYKGGGGPYSSLDQDFFASTEGTIAFKALTSDPNVFQENTVQIDRNKSPMRFQLGPRANDKTPAFGASVWIQSDPSQINDPNIPMISDHWDLNLELREMPEPTTVVVWGCLVGLGAVVRRRPASV